MASYMSITSIISRYYTWLDLSSDGHSRGTGWDRSHDQKPHSIHIKTLQGLYYYKYNQCLLPITNIITSNPIFIIFKCGSSCSRPQTFFSSLRFGHLCNPINQVRLVFKVPEITFVIPELIFT